MIWSCLVYAALSLGALSFFAVLVWAVTGCVLCCCKRWWWWRCCKYAESFFGLLLCVFSTINNVLYSKSCSYACLMRIDNLIAQKPMFCSITCRTPRISRSGTYVFVVFSGINFAYGALQSTIDILCSKKHKDDWYVYASALINSLTNSRAHYTHRDSNSNNQRTAHCFWSSARTARCYLPQIWCVCIVMRSGDVRGAI